MDEDLAFRTLEQFLAKVPAVDRRLGDTSGAATRHLSEITDGGAQTCQ